MHTAILRSLRLYTNQKYVEQVYSFPVHLHICARMHILATVYMHSCRCHSTEGPRVMHFSTFIHLCIKRELPYFIHQGLVLMVIVLQNW